MKWKGWNILHFIVTALLFVSCGEDEKPQLDTPKTPYYGTELQTNGYYSLPFNNGEARHLSYVLYRDGTVLYGGSPITSQVSEREKEYGDGTFYDIAKNEKTFWGVFTITGNDIMFNQWYLRDGGILTSYKTFGTVLNDSTFVMTSTDREGLESVNLDEIYRFKPLSTKPDSTNQFL